MTSHYERTGMENYRKERLKAEEKYLNMWDPSDTYHAKYHMNSRKKLECSHYENGYLNGYTTKYYPNGNISEKYYIRNNLKEYNGYRSLYDENENIINESYTYLDGKCVVVVYNNGVISFINEYVQEDSNYRDYLTTYYYRNGELRSEKKYKNGKLRIEEEDDVDEKICTNYYKSGIISIKNVDFHYAYYYKNRYKMNFYKNKKTLFY